MVAKFIKCSNCSGSDFEVLEDGRLKCSYCGTYTTPPEEQAEPVPEASAPTPVPQPAPAGEAGNTDTAWLAVIVILFAVTIFGWLVYEAWHQEAYKAEVNTIGQYTLPGIVCPGTATTVTAEYGFEQKPSVLTVTLTYGKGHWVVSSEAIEAIKVRRLMEKNYLWVHCDTLNKEPSYFATAYDLPLPVDGQEVVIRK